MSLSVMHHVPCGSQIVDLTLLSPIVSDKVDNISTNKSHFRWLIAAPYGIRESTEKIGSKKNTTVPEERLEDHYPSKMQYALGDIYRDLLNFAADKLIMNGKLVFWIPIIR